MYYLCKGIIRLAASVSDIGPHMDSLIMYSLKFKLMFYWLIRSLRVSTFIVVHICEMIHVPLYTIILSTKLIHAFYIQHLSYY